MRLSSATSIRCHHRAAADTKGGVHHFVLGSRRAHGGIGAVLEMHQHVQFRAERRSVKFDCFGAAAVEKQVGLNRGVVLCRGHNLINVLVAVSSLRRTKRRARDIFLNCASRRSKLVLSLKRTAAIQSIAETALFRTLILRSGLFPKERTCYSPYPDRRQSNPSPARRFWTCRFFHRASRSSPRPF